MVNIRFTFTLNIMVRVIIILFGLQIRATFTLIVGVLVRFMLSIRFRVRVYY
jgi:hypothetical protein